MMKKNTLRELTLNELHTVSGGTGGFVYDAGQWVGKWFRRNFK